MNRVQTKPNRAVGILFVIVIVIMLISGLAPPAGAQDASDNPALKWETGVWERHMGASSLFVEDIHSDGAY